MRTLKPPKLAASNRTLIIQPLPGIGDMIWHLPHIHAIARTTTEGWVDVLTKPRSRADQLLGADPSVRRILWLERDTGGSHAGLVGAVRLVKLLRQGHYDRIWLFHDSARYALAAWLAGITERIGYGFGIGRGWLNGMRLPRQQRNDHPIAKADALLALYEILRLEGDSRLQLTVEQCQSISHRFAHMRLPWVTLGIGSSETWKQWGEANFTALACAINQHGWGLPVLIGGGPQEAALAARISDQVEAVGGHIFNGVNLTVAETAAVIANSQLYIGNDTGFLNMAAALGVDALGLFGSSPPLSYSPFIHVILPDDGRGGDYASRNMAGISVAAVLRHAASLLSDKKPVIA